MSSSDCFSDLICDEDSGTFIEDSPDLEFPDDVEDTMAGFIEDEGEYVPGFEYPTKFQSQSLDVLAREESVQWILKVHAYYNFLPLTAYLAVNYLDRFLASRSLPQANGWPLQLLSVACLSLAAKVEETLVPNLLDLQVEGAKFVFEPRMIRRMELLVLDALNWKLRSITPFTFIDFFAYKVNLAATCIPFLVSSATQTILDILREIKFLNYFPSTIAVAAILCAAAELPNLSHVGPTNAVTWCHGLSKDGIMGCYKLMQEVVVGPTRRKRPPKVLQQLRIMTHHSDQFDYGDSSSSSSSFNKRRKLNNSIDKDKL